MTNKASDLHPDVRRFTELLTWRLNQHSDDEDFTFIYATKEWDAYVLQAAFQNLGWMAGEANKDSTAWYRLQTGLDAVLLLMRYLEVTGAYETYETVDAMMKCYDEEDAKKVAKRLRKIEAQLHGEGTVLDRSLNRAAVNSQGFWDKQQYLDRIAFIAGAAWDAMEKDHQVDDE